MAEVSKLDADDAMLEGAAEAMEAFNEFMMEWHLPSMVAQAKPMWVNLSPEQKESLKQMNPELYEALSQAFSVNP